MLIFTRGPRRGGGGGAAADEITNALVVFVIFVVFVFAFEPLRGQGDGVQARRSMAMTDTLRTTASLTLP